MPDSIQLGEYSRSSGLGGVSYNSDDDPNVLSAGRDGAGPWLDACWGHPVSCWHDHGAFAFLVPETLFISRPASAGLSWIGV